MGLEQAISGGGTVYLTAREGYFCAKPDGTEEPEQLREFINKDKSTTTRKVYGALIGKIDDVDIDDGEYGKRLRIWMSDGPDKFCLQSKYDRGIATDFYRVMENIDFSEEVRMLYMSSGDYHNLRIMQRLKEPLKVTWRDGTVKEYKIGDWKSVQWSMKADEIPGTKEVVVNGQTMKDRTDQLMYFGKKLKAVQQRLATLKAVPEPTEGEADLSDVGDLPF